MFTADGLDSLKFSQSKPHREKSLCLHLVAYGRYQDIKNKKNITLEELIDPDYQENSLLSHVLQLLVDKANYF